MRKIAVICLLLVGIQAMAQTTFGQRPNVMKATHDSIIASFADKGKQLTMMKGQWAGVKKDTTSYFMKSVMTNKSALRISSQDVRRYTHNVLPSSKNLFEDQQMKRLRQTDLYWNNNRDTWTGIGSYILDAIFN